MMKTLKFVRQVRTFSDTQHTVKRNVKDTGVGPKVTESM